MRRMMRERGKGESMMTYSTQPVILAPYPFPILGPYCLIHPGGGCRLEDFGRGTHFVIPRECWIVLWLSAWNAWSRKRQLHRRAGILGRTPRTTGMTLAQGQELRDRFLVSTPCFIPLHDLAHTWTYAKRYSHLHPFVVPTPD